MRAHRLAVGTLVLSAMLVAAPIALAQAGARNYTSELGFEFSYPAPWTGNLAGDFPLLKAGDLEPRVLRNPEFRASACNQKVFFTKLNAPASNLVAGAIPTDCMGQLPSLEGFSSTIKNRIGHYYSLSVFEEASYRVGEQLFWALRARGSATKQDTDTSTVEYVATVLPKGLVYWSLVAEGASEAPANDFHRIALKLTGGVSSQLVPAGTHFSALKLVPPEALAEAQKLVRDALTPDANVSHHFESGFGFSYDVPTNLAILNANRVAAVAQAAAGLPHRPDAESSTADCEQKLLIAEDLRQPQVLTILAHQAECAGLRLTAMSLPQLGASTLKAFSARFELSHVQTAVTQLGEHPVWAMRAAMLPREAGNPLRHLAVLLIPVPEGIAEITLQTASREKLESLMATQILFDDGAQSQLIPVSVLHAQ